MDQAKLEAAKAYLGTAWVLHPQYQPRRHHAHRTSQPVVLRRITLLAKRAGRI